MQIPGRMDVELTVGELRNCHMFISVLDAKGNSKRPGGIFLGVAVISLGALQKDAEEQNEACSCRCASFLDVDLTCDAITVGKVSGKVQFGSNEKKSNTSNDVAEEAELKALLGQGRSTLTERQRERVVELMQRIQKKDCSLSSRVVPPLPPRPPPRREEEALKLAKEESLKMQEEITEVASKHDEQVARALLESTRLDEQISREEMEIILAMEESRQGASQANSTSNLFIR